MPFRIAAEEKGIKIDNAMSTWPEVNIECYTLKR